MVSSEGAKNIWLKRGNQKGRDKAEGGKKGKKYSKKNHQETKLAEQNKWDCLWPNMLITKNK